MPGRASRARTIRRIARHALSPAFGDADDRSWVASVAPWIEIETETTRAASSSATASEIGKPFVVIVTRWPSSLA